MFRKTRKKIILTVTVSLILLFAATLSVIYGFSYWEIRSRNMDMLRRYAEIFSLESPPGDVPFLQPPALRNDFPLEEPSFQLSTFYSAAVSDSGEILSLDAGRSGLYTEEEIEAVARTLLSRGKTRGTYRTLLYLLSVKNGYTLVSFMDDTVGSSSIRTLLRYSLLCGGLAIALITAAAVLISGRIVKPLEENDRRQKQFIADAGHELKTPVSIIETNAELLSRQSGDNEWLSNIRHEAVRMGDLITQLLDLSHAGHSDTPKETVDLSRLVLGEVLPFEIIAYEKGLSIETSIREGILAEGNPLQLKQLVSVLLDNAVRHSVGRDPITLTLTQERRHAVLAVSNRAEELSPEHCEKLFDRFYRVDPVRNSSEKHYGLGLSIAKEITDAHRGTIEASWHDGTAVFTVKLPGKK